MKSNYIIAALLIIISTGACIYTILKAQKVSRIKEADSSPATASNNINKLLIGYLLSILAAAFWATGNVLTKYTVHDYGHEFDIAKTMDVALAKYLSGAITVLILSIAFYLFNPNKSKLPTLKSLLNKNIFIAATFKGLNTICFISAIIFILAGTVAAIENLHLIWTAILVSLLTRTRISKAFIINGVILLAGVFMILPFDQMQINPSRSGTGVVLAILAGIAFSLFVFYWDEALKNKNNIEGIRGLDTSLFLFLSGIAIYFMYMAFAIVIHGDIGLPFAHISAHHFMIQFFSGIFTIGITYFLLQEALRLMRSAGKSANFLLGLGISYAVMFTLLFEDFAFSIPITWLQWAGLILFTIGFALSQKNILSDGQKISN